MALAFVPPQHLEHLSGNLQSGDEALKEVQTLLRSNSPEERLRGIDRLGEYHPELIPRLASIWAFQGRRAIHVWELPCLAVTQLPAISRAIQKAKEERRLLSDRRTWTIIRDERLEGEGKDPRVHRAAEGVDSLDLVVRLTKVRRYREEDELNEVNQTHEVHLHLSFKGEMPLAEVYAGYQDARASLRAALKWILGSDIPQRGPTQDEYFRPLKFSEVDAKALEKQLEMDLISVRGPHPTGEVGEHQVWGHWGSDDFQPLDASSLIVAAQEGQPNALRTCRYKFIHPEDNFEERALISFNFLGKQPHVTFEARTSRPAMDYFLAALYNRVQPR